MRKIIFFLVFLVSNNVNAEVFTEFKIFKEKPIFENPIAYVRSPDSGITVNTSRYAGQPIGYLDAIFGGDFPLVTLNIRAPSSFDHLLKLQLGVEAATWATLGYKEGAFPLLTQDFLVAIPLLFRYAGFSGAVKFNHISGHLGDGFEELVRETLPSDEKIILETADDLARDYGLGVISKEPFSYSRDFFSCHIAYDDLVGNLARKVYLQYGYAHKIFPKGTKRSFAGGGFEIKYKAGTFDPFYAQDTTWNQDVDSVDLSIQTGVYILSQSKSDLFEVRLAGTIYIGSDRRGQLMGRKIKQFGLGLFIR